MHFLGKMLITTLMLVLCLNSSGQGCSDAGFCSLNSFKPGNSDQENYLNQIRLGTSYGRAEYSIGVITSYVEFNRKLNDKLAVDLKLLAQSQSGNGINNFGFSDAYLTANYKLSQKTLFTFGFKIPFHRADKMKDGLPLPMDYQSSLGTFDLITGLGFSVNKLQFAAALQQPLSQNMNRFDPELYPQQSVLKSFPSTNMFKRSGDVLLRASYPVVSSGKLTITPGLLSIYHLANDRFIDGMGKEMEIPGSQGLTLNGNVFFDFAATEKTSIQLSMGAPLMVRDARPDGLTRKFVIGLEYSYRF